MRSDSSTSAKPGESARPVECREPDREAGRKRLATLIGRLLARRWLRDHGVTRGQQPGGSEAS